MNTPKLSGFLQKSMDAAAIEAQKRGHIIIWPEHVLAGLCKDITIFGTLRDVGVNAATLPEQVYNELEKRKILSRETASDTPAEGYSSSVQLILQHATTLSDIRPDINCLAVLKALTQSETAVGDILKKMGLDNLTPQAPITSPVQAEETSVSDSHPTRKGYKRRLNDRRETPMLPALVSAHENDDDDKELPDFCTDLVARARSGGLEEVHDRDSEIENVQDILLRQKKRNPLLVGHAGVGKTAIVEGLAWRIAHGQVPYQLKHKRIYSINPAMLEGGTEHRGAFEKKLGDFLKKVTADPNTILFIDETHTFMGLGAVSSGGTDASNMLKPYMARGDISVIGATTFKDMKKITKDDAVDRRFQTVKIDEPTLDSAIRMVTKSIRSYQETHNVTYSRESIRTAALLADRYITGKKMPDKIFDVIDDAGVLRKKKSDGHATVTAQDIRNAVAKRTGINVKQLGKSDTEKLMGFDDALKRNIIGQEEAVTVLANAARMARSPLRDPSKPISFLFEGPTGVGKTESVKQLAKMLDMNFIRVDMSEMMEAHSVSKLIGAPPGFVGYDEGGQLTDQVDQNPYSVVLLDEIEKAHPSILNITLQALDYGKITDASGNHINFRNTIIVMTTNAGVAGVKNEMGFNASSSGKEAQIKENAKSIFSPEFLNRFDKVITFHYLAEKNMPPIADKFLCAAQTRLDELKLTLDCQDSAKTWLIKKGFSAEDGARPMKRLIESAIIEPINNAFVAGLLKKKGTATVSFNESAGKTESPLKFEFTNPGAKGPVPKVA